MVGGSIDAMFLGPLFAEKRQWAYENSLFEVAVDRNGQLSEELFELFFAG